MDDLFNWDETGTDLLRKWARQYVGWATHEMSDPEDLEWSLEKQFPVSEFKLMNVDWDDYYKDDVLQNPRYDPSFITEEWHNPIVISLENDEIIIWDGWHRIATSIARQDECITTIVGRLPKKAVCSEVI